MFPAVKNRVLGDRGLGRREAEAGQGGGGGPAKTGMRRAGAGRLGRAGLGCSTTKKNMKVIDFDGFSLLMFPAVKKHVLGLAKR